MSSNENGAANSDTPTLLAIGAVAGCAMPVVHEVLGHCLVTLLLGAHPTHVSSIDSSYGGAVPRPAMRAIAAAGIAANFAAGVIVLKAAERLSPAASIARYAAWVLGHATLFMGSSYLAGFAFLGVGDVHAAIGGLSRELVWQIALGILGVTVYWFTLRDAQRALEKWAGSGATTRRLALVPYLAMGITNVLAASFNPSGPFYGALWAAAATFGACSGLLFAANDASRAGLASRTAIRIERNPFWISAGAIATLLLFFVLGPGLPR